MGNPSSSTHMRQRLRKTKLGGHVLGRGNSFTAVVRSPVRTAFVDVSLGLAGGALPAFGLPRLLEVGRVGVGALRLLTGWQLCFIRYLMAIGMLAVRCCSSCSMKSIAVASSPRMHEYLCRTYSCAWLHSVTKSYGAGERGLVLVMAARCCLISAKGTVFLALAIGDLLSFQGA